MLHIINKQYIRNTKNYLRVTQVKYINYWILKHNKVCAAGEGTQNNTKYEHSGKKIEKLIVNMTVDRIKGYYYHWQLLKHLILVATLLIQSTECYNINGI